MKKWKIVIDVLLLIDTILLLDIDYFGRLAHEILGIAMAMLILIHIVFNWSWVKQVSKNLKKVNLKTKFMYVVNILIMLTYLGAIVFGIMISNELFRFKNASNFKFVVTHIIFGRLAVIMMFLHIGLHLDRAFRKIKKDKIKIILYVFYSVLSGLVSIYLIYILTHSFQWVSVFGV